MTVPYPFGVSRQAKGLNFSLVAPHANGVSLCFFDPETKKCVVEYPLSPQTNKTGQVWHIAIPDLDENLLYASKIHPPHSENHAYPLNTQISGKREGLDVAICDEGIASAISEKQSGADSPSQLAEIGHQAYRHGKEEQAPSASCKE